MIFVDEESKEIEGIFMNVSGDDHQIGIRTKDSNLDYKRGQTIKWKGTASIEKPIGDFLDERYLLFRL